jgi:glycerol uptake facilitator-like aquaporin
MNIEIFMKWLLFNCNDHALQAFEHWFWIPWLLPHLGGILGALIYTFLIELHHPPEEAALKH